MFEIILLVTAGLGVVLLAVAAWTVKSAPEGAEAAANAWDRAVLWAVPGGVCLLGAVFVFALDHLDDGFRWAR